MPSTAHWVINVAEEYGSRTSKVSASINVIIGAFPAVHPEPGGRSIIRRGSPLRTHFRRAVQKLVEVSAHMYRVARDTAAPASR